ncbi:MAG: DUF6677 family protein [Planctomycetota bacterium]
MSRSSDPSAKTSSVKSKAGASANDPNTIEVDGQIVSLKNRHLAAFLSWLWPGAGQIYQGRTTKGWLFMIAVMSAWITGFAVGGRNVVYASRVPGDQRYHFLAQVAVGGPSLPAIVQMRRMNQATDRGRTRPDYEPLFNGFMAPPNRPVVEKEVDEVSAWYAVHGIGYEMGTWYTVIAGLLNILVIYDAFGGPLATPISGRRRDDEPPADGDLSPGTA